MFDHGIELVFDAGAMIGGSSTWCKSEAALYWIDVKNWHSTAFIRTAEKGGNG